MYHQETDINKMHHKRFQLLKNTKALYTLFLIALFSSCKVTYQPSYFSDVSRPVDTVINIPEIYHEPTIKGGDVLSLNVTTLDQLTNMDVYQAPVGGNVSGSGSTTLNLPQNNLYTVSKDGTIEVPVIGKVVVSGKTLSEAKELIRTQYAGYF